MDYEIWMPNSMTLDEMNINDVNIRFLDNDVNIRFLDNIDTVRRGSLIVNVDVDDICYWFTTITEQSDQDKYLERIGAK